MRKYETIPHCNKFKLASDSWVDLHHHGGTECKKDKTSGCAMKEYVSGQAIDFIHFPRFSINKNELCAYFKKANGGINGEDCDKSKDVVCQIDCSSVTTTATTVAAQKGEF